MVGFARIILTDGHPGFISEYTVGQVIASGYRIDGAGDSNVLQRFGISVCRIKDGEVSSFPKPLVQLVNV